MALIIFALASCGLFVGLTRLVVSASNEVMNAVLIGLAFFVLPLTLISPLTGLLWGGCVFGAWAMSDSARYRRLRFPSGRLPDNVPDEWRLG